MWCDVVVAKTQSGSLPPLAGEGWGGGRQMLLENHSPKIELFLTPYCLK